MSRCLATTYAIGPLNRCRTRNWTIKPTADILAPVSRRDDHRSRKWLKMRFSLKTPLMSKVLFLAILVAGVIIWRLGASYLETSSSTEEEPSQVERFEIKPL